MTIMRNLLASALALAALAAPTSGAEEITLFDGRHIVSWEGEKNKVWRIEDGVIVGGSLAGNPRNEFLASLRFFRDFELRLEYKLTGTDGFINGGVQFRSRRLAEPAHEMRGYQADIGAGYSGSLYDESRRNRVLAPADPELIRRIEKPGDWNTYVIRCEGRRIQLFLNGAQTVDYTEAEPDIEADGVLGLQIHGNCKAEIRFRNITVTNLSEPTMPDEQGILRRFGDVASPPPVEPWRQARFDVADDDVIVFAGQANFVRAQREGSLEERLVTRHGGRRPRVRWMAWEGDTVYDQWRDLNFGSWRSQLDAIGATVVVAQFGQIEALDGLGKLPAFIGAYERLLQQFIGRTPRIALVSPMPFEKPRQPLAPDLSEKNSVVQAYADAVRDIARKHGALFVDLSRSQSAPGPGGPLTDNGLHLNDRGLRHVSDQISGQLGWSRAVELSDSQRTKLREAIVEKNRLWFDCWRPPNWSFVYGDRLKQPFAQPAGGRPSLRESFEDLKPRIAAMDRRIWAAARGEPVAEPVPPPLPPLRTDVKALSPEEEEATLTPADGYRVNLFASERDGVVKPTQIAWDERGRLYVACSPGYPHLVPGTKPVDYILRLEDTDGDGRADRSQRVVEGLKMVQGLEPGAGGLYVCDYDQLLHMRDTDGDGVMETRTVIFSGFGVGDTHQMINSIAHGPDGSLWFTQGLHVFSRVETPWGLAKLDRAGLWRLRPRTLRLDSFFNGAKAGHNCWGVAFDDYHQLFHKAGDRPGGFYSVPGLIKVADVDEYHPAGAIFLSYPKSTSLEIIGTRALPDDVQGCAAIAGYFGNVVELHRIVDDGAGFKSTELPRLLKSTSAAFRPVDLSTGPEGALYVADWFNLIIGHYQASYVDPRRDRSHGRIWRITAKDRAPAQRPNLASMRPAQLLDQLRSPERWTRYHAKRLLFDLPTGEVTAAADAWLRTLDAGDPANERLLLELIGIFEAHEAVRPALLDKLLHATDPRVRAYGTRVIGAWHDRLGAPLELLRARIADAHPRVRLEAIVASANIPQAESAALAIRAIDAPRDRFIDYALTHALRALQPAWLPELEAGRLDFGGNEKHLEFARQFARTPRADVHPGKATYDLLCMSCHQPDARGIPGVYPSLVNREWVAGEKEIPIRVVLHGLAGPITVGGETFGADPALPPMPPAALDDQQIADVLTYLRTHFGNHAPEITTADVEKVRAESASRTSPWTAAELKR